MVFFLEDTTNHPPLFLCFCHSIRDLQVTIITQFVRSMEHYSKLKFQAKTKLKNQMADLGIIGVIIKSVLMHDPVRFLAMWGSAFIEHQSLPHSNPFEAAVYHLITACGLPKPSCSGAISPGSRGIFLVLVAEEVPIVLRGGSYSTLLCKNPSRYEHHKGEDTRYLDGIFNKNCKLREKNERR